MDFRKIIIICALPWSMISTCYLAETSGSSRQKMHMVIGVLDDDVSSKEIAHVLENIVSMPSAPCIGFNVTYQEFSAFPNKRALKKINTDLIVFLKTGSHGTKLEWRVYDVAIARMLAGEHFNSVDQSVKLIAEHCANRIWKTLTGQESFFSSRIAYCEGRQVKNRVLKLSAPYTAPDQEENRSIVAKGHIFAPRWNRNISRPTLYFSEATACNVRLVRSDLQSNKQIISNFEEQNMFPSFSCDGKTVVYCVSKEGLSQLFMHARNEDNESSLRQLTFNGNNVSPTLLSDGNIVFCSDKGASTPYVCVLNSKTGQIDNLTRGVSPAVCEQKEIVAYAKNYQGIMQIFIYNLRTKESYQLTQGFGDKDQPSFSPCGNYIAYTQESGGLSRIAIMNIAAKESWWLTAKQSYCCYPCWSPWSNAFIT